MKSGPKSLDQAMENCTSDSFCLVAPHLECWEIQLCLEMIFVCKGTKKKDKGCTTSSCRWEERKPATHVGVMGQWSAADLTPSQCLSRFQSLGNQDHNRSITSQKQLLCIWTADQCSPSTQSSVLWCALAVQRQVEQESWTGKWL